MIKYIKKLFAKKQKEAPQEVNKISSNVVLSDGEKSIAETKKVIPLLNEAQEWMKANKEDKKLKFDTITGELLLTNKETKGDENNVIVDQIYRDGFFSFRERNGDMRCPPKLKTKQ